MTAISSLIRTTRNRLKAIDRERAGLEKRLADLALEREGAQAMLDVLVKPKPLLTTNEAEIIIRDWAMRRKEKFTEYDITEDLGLPVHGSTSGRRALNRLVRSGTLSVKGPKEFRMYQWSKPVSEGAAARVQRTAPVPEAPPTPSYNRGRGGPVAGTGRVGAVLDKEVRELIQPALRSGWTLIASAGTHPKIVKGSRSIPLPSTIGRGRAFANLEAHLKREGVL